MRSVLNPNLTARFTEWQIDGNLGNTAALGIVEREWSSALLLFTPEPRIGLLSHRGSDFDNQGMVTQGQRHRTDVGKHRMGAMPRVGS